MQVSQMMLHVFPGWTLQASCTSSCGAFLIEGRASRRSLSMKLVGKTSAFSGLSNSVLHCGQWILSSSFWLRNRSRHCWQNVCRQGSVFGFWSWWLYMSRHKEHVNLSTSFSMIVLELTVMYSTVEPVLDHIHKKHVNLSTSFSVIVLELTILRILHCRLAPVLDHIREVWVFPKLFPFPLKISWWLQQGAAQCNWGALLLVTMDPWYHCRDM